MAKKVHYEEVLCRTALNRVSGMPFRWSLNPYRGCVHGCHYCFARRYHGYYDLNAGDDFSGVVFAKTNVAQVLRAELARPSWRREVVSVGTATDPYQPIEGRYRLTRGCLEAFVQYHSPVAVVTKGTLIVRDIDLLAELSGRADCTVCFSITTLDADLARRLEPGTPPPAKRLRAMELLVEAGVNAGVFLAPVLPGITDDEANLRSVARTAAESGARFLSASVLYLKPGTKEHYLGFIEREYPELAAAYDRLYPGAYAPGWVQSTVKESVRDLKAAYGLVQRPGAAAGRPSAPRQLQMALR